jgi:hypothetical protein
MTVCCCPWQAGPRTLVSYCARPAPAHEVFSSFLVRMVRPGPLAEKRRWDCGPDGPTSRARYGAGRAGSPYTGSGARCGQSDVAARGSRGQQDRGDRAACRRPRAACARVAGWCDPLTAPRPLGPLIDMLAETSQDRRSTRGIDLGQARRPKSHPGGRLRSPTITGGAVDLDATSRARGAGR